VTIRLNGLTFFSAFICEISDISVCRFGLGSKLEGHRDSKWESRPAKIPIPTDEGSLK
jgi:hypothetical protein